MIALARWLERYALPLPGRRKMYEHIIASFEEKGKVVGRRTKQNLREYYRLPPDEWVISQPLTDDDISELKRSFENRYK